MRKTMAWPLLAAGMMATSANAAPWVVDTAHSSLLFQGDQGGSVFHGGFKQFTAEIAPTRPAPSQVWPP